MVKLTEEQQLIVDKWKKEQEELEKLITLLADKKISEDEFIEKIRGISPTHCEHGRSIMGMCSACLDIERIIKPELFNEDGSLIE